MAKKARGRGGAQQRAVKSKSTGIEKYGGDEADEYLGLKDDTGSEAEASSGVDEEEVFAPQEEEWDEDTEKTPGFKALKGKKKGKKVQEPSDEEEEVSAMKEAASIGSVGWKGQDFYGGEDVGGDSSDGGSEEELNFQEAKRLEESRAQRLGGLAVSNPLAVLLGNEAGQVVDDEAEEEKVVPAAMSSRFESTFEADAEKGTVQKDVSKLSEAERRALIKKEAPELAPLLQDFQAKLAAFRELAPLLQPQALKKIPKSGVEYLQAKGALLLNTLTNLSFYVLLRAEGGDVRNHPVISQLVWLKEIHDKAAPLDTKLRSKLRKALKALKKVQAEEGESHGEGEDGDPHGAGVKVAAEAGDQKRTRPKLSLREKLDRLRAEAAARGSPDGASAAESAAQAARELKTADLLRLPGRRREKVGGGSRPDDLDEVDPLVGRWAPTCSLGQQLSFVRQYLGEGRSAAKSSSADQDVEARQRRRRDRVREEPLPSREIDERPPKEAADETGDFDEDELVLEARRSSAAKKEQKSARKAAREEARLLRQHKPEEVVDGRRKTSKKILTNRGLVRHRKKEAGNARVTNRKKYEKRLKRRRGAVLDMREGADDGATYAGEATGLRTHVKKSMRLS